MTAATERLAELETEIARAERALAATVAEARRQAAAVAVAPTVERVATGGDDHEDGG